MQAELQDFSAKLPPDTSPAYIAWLEWINKL